VNYAAEVKIRAERLSIGATNRPAMIDPFASAVFPGITNSLSHCPPVTTFVVKDLIASPFHAMILPWENRSSLWSPACSWLRPNSSWPTKL
jgi:hypothetical protein